MVDIKNDITRKFINDKIDELTQGKSEQAQFESLNRLIFEDADFIKGLLIASAKEKQQTLVKDIIGVRDNYRAQYTQSKSKLDKYENDMKKLEDFKKSFR